MALVKRLRGGQSGARRKSVTAIRLALQRSQIKKRRRRGAPFDPRLGRFADLAATFVGDFLRPRLVPDSLGLFRLVGGFGGVGGFVARFRRRFFGGGDCRIDPAPVVAPGGGFENGFDLPIIGGDEFLNLAFAVDDNRQSRRLHAPHRRQHKAAAGRIERRHRPQVALMPTNQSAFERQIAADSSGTISESARKDLKPFRIASGVIDCNHKRRISGSIAVSSRFRAFRERFDVARKWLPQILKD